MLSLDRILSTAKFENLAIFGGPPTFAEHLHVGRPAIGNVEDVLDRIRESLVSRTLTNNGPFVREFERRICDVTQTKHAIAVTNATQGLQMTIRALGMKGSVIVPSFTFVATAQALHWQGIKPVFCDVDPQTHCIDLRDVERKISSNTDIGGIVGVQMWGRACDVDGLTELASRHNVPLLLDAAHAFGSKHNGLPIGNGGDAEVFSFHATKIVNAFEGGAITTNDEQLADQLRLMRNFGFADYDSVVHSGTNAKMCEAAAAMGITSIESLDKFLAINRAALEQYRVGLDAIPGMELLVRLLDPDSNCQYAVVEVNESAFGMSRDRLLEVLWAENILARKYFSPGCHRVPFLAGEKPPKLPITDALCGHVLQLPTGSAVDCDQIGQICDLLHTIAMHAKEIVKRIEQSGSVRQPRGATLQP